MESYNKVFNGTFNKSLFFLGMMLAGVYVQAQIGKQLQQGNISGNVQLNTQYYITDSLIGTQDVAEDLLFDGFANLIYTNGKIEAGLRYESYQNVRLGFPTGYKGNGIPYRYVTYRDEKLQITAGNFYEQFGTGMILRAYEERGLGYDNAFDGFRLQYSPLQGLTLKGLVGKQRVYFDLGDGIVRAFDGELNVNDAIKSLNEAKTRIILGGSFVSKFQADQNTLYNLPENVGSWAGRANIISGGFNFMGEYVYKIPDPSNDNQFIYKDGHAALLQATYSTKGFGLSLAAKRIDNMSFRSDRDAGVTDLLINYLPALTRQHTYNVIATLYPYATQPNGEIGFQGELVYTIPKKSTLGGKYGTKLLVNFGSANNIDTVKLNDEATTRKGYKSDFFEIGENYFNDFNVELYKKFSKKFKLKATYANIAYNKRVIEGKPELNDSFMVFIDAAILDFTYKLNKKNAIRTEIQGLWTKRQSDQGHWATVVVEYTYSPHWGFAVMDQYNYGNKDKKKRLHYPFVSLTYTNKATKFLMSYGRQRAGLFCVGGICRVVPSSNGFQLTMTHSF